MSANSFRLTRTSRTVIALFLGAALLLSAVILSSTSNAGAEVALKAKKSKVLGAIGKLPEARCPADCSGLAIVSGFQSEIGGVGNAYRVPYKGFITKWKISLGKPTRSQRNFFEERFGTTPKAGISVIKPVRVNGKKRYKLMKRSPILGLNKYMGKVSSIALKKPIPVKKGQYVALTVPTWATALGARYLEENGEIVRENGKPVLDGEYSWRASRERDNCGTPNMQNSAPQTEPGSRFEYGCRFYGGQLLYRVKVVTNR